MRVKAENLPDEQGRFLYELLEGGSMGYLEYIITTMLNIKRKL